VTTLTATISDQFACLLSESQLTDDGQRVKMGTECQKVFTSGSWVFSGSGWNRPGDILAYQMKWPTVPVKYQNKPDELTGWVVKSLVPKISNLLIQHKAIDLDKGTAIQDAEFLIATHGQVWLLDEGFGITPIQDFYVSGSGGNIALGALTTLQNIKDDWKQNHHVYGQAAIEAAIKWDIYSGGAIRGYISKKSGQVAPIT
jgi:hypothetical protein